jgi:SNF2 family DNA or RNA helicase
MLDLIGAALRTNGFLFEQIDGNKSDLQRRSSIERFRANPDCVILLASVGSAGVG